MYDSNNMAMSGRDIHTLIDEICTMLYSGCHWHLRAANYSRRNNIRGLGRWHDSEAKGDFCALMRFEKIVGDKLGHNVTINMEMVTRAEAYKMQDMAAFKAHFELWERHEEELIKKLNEAINAARTVDMQVYKELMCVLEEVQSEVMRARMVEDSFEFGGWSGHDMSVKSKWIHEYFEHEHKDGEDINFNLG